VRLAEEATIDRLSAAADRDEAAREQGRLASELSHLPPAKSPMAQFEDRLDEMDAMRIQHKIVVDKLGDVIDDNVSKMREMVANDDRCQQEIRRLYDALRGSSALTKQATDDRDMAVAELKQLKLSRLPPATGQLDTVLAELQKQRALNAELAQSLANVQDDLDAKTVALQKLDVQLGTQRKTTATALELLVNVFCGCTSVGKPEVTMKGIGAHLFIFGTNCNSKYCTFIRDYEA
jgi:hypothetical protein